MNTAVAYVQNQLIEITGSTDADVWRGFLGDAVISIDFEAWLNGVSPEPSQGLQKSLAKRERRMRGVYFTPPEIAVGLAEKLNGCEAVLDPACGGGELLSACSAKKLFGIDSDLSFVISTAARLKSEGRECLIRHGNGLDISLWPDEIDAVIANPPYVGEKGNAELFRQLKIDFPELKPYFGIRMDLLYLFLHRILERLPTLKKAALLTSEYWLVADGAKKLRSHMDGNVSELTRLGGRKFKEAPGHHSLITVLESGSESCLVNEERQVRLEGETWSPFSEVPKGEGTPLGELTRIRQGIVSGADKVSKRKAELFDLVAGDPVYIRREKIAGLPFKPIIRREDCVANHVFREPLSSSFILYVDDSESPSEVIEIEKYLLPFRTLLEARREVVAGKISWRRLHWPRVRAHFAVPKIVVPRHAKHARFCLDLAGHFISSDCTYILAPISCKNPEAYLDKLMRYLNEHADLHLRNFGKTKGAIIEYYSSPLSGFPVEDGVIGA